MEKNNHSTEHFYNECLSTCSGQNGKELAAATSNENSWMQMDFQNVPDKWVRGDPLND